MIQHVNGFDYAILRLLSSPAFHSQKLDLFFERVAENLLLKGGVVMAAVWALWFGRTAIGSKGLLRADALLNAARRRMLIGFAGTVLALFVARTIEVSFPMRWRPLNFPNLFHFPAGLDVGPNAFYRNDSCFPSDHAALFFALATTMFYVSRRVGAWALIYVSVVIAFPRAYLSLHYPTDLIAGALIGVLSVMLAHEMCSRLALGRAIIERLIRWSMRSPSSFYAVLFVWSFSVGEMFEGARKLLYVGSVLKPLLVRH